MLGDVFHILLVPLLHTYLSDAGILSARTGKFASTVLLPQRLCQWQTLSGSESISSEQEGRLCWRLYWQAASISTQQCLHPHRHPARAGPVPGVLKDSIRIGGPCLHYHSVQRRTCERNKIAMDGRREREAPKNVSHRCWETRQATTHGKELLKSHTHNKTYLRG